MERGFRSMLRDVHPPCSTGGRMVAANVGHDVEEVADDTALRRHKTEASPDEGEHPINLFL